MLAVAVACLLAALVEAAPPAYKIDTIWPLEKLTLAGAFFTAVAVEPGTGRVHAAQRNSSFGEPILVFDRLGHHLASWGSNVVAQSGAQWGVHGMNLQPDLASANGNEFFIWITDVIAHTVTAVRPPVAVQRRMGTPQKAGNGTDPLQFGNVADVDFGGNRIFISDGDGGVNNRVLAFADINATAPMYVRGSKGDELGQFSSPHSVTFHPASDTLFVADRGNNRTQQLSAQTGEPLGEWTCMRPGTPVCVDVRSQGASSAIEGRNVGSHFLFLLFLPRSISLSLPVFHFYR